MGWPGFGRNELTVEHELALKEEGNDGREVD